MTQSSPNSGPQAGVVVATVRAMARQAWVFCAVYLALGLGAEVFRRAGSSAATVVLAFLDSLPNLALRRSGLMETYLDAILDDRLTPFWNRVLLSSVALSVIAGLALASGLLLLGVWSLMVRVPKRGR